MKYAVTAQAFDRLTGFAEGKARTEVIDTSTNVIFRRCTTIMMVKEAYESFWNNMNPCSKAIVFVQQVSQN